MVRGKMKNVVNRLICFMYFHKWLPDETHHGILHEESTDATYFAANNVCYFGLKRCARCGEERTFRF
jgi:hypothetical protein